MKKKSGPRTVTVSYLWTCDDVAEYIGCTARHVRNLMKLGLPHFYAGRMLRFDPEEVRTFLLNHRRFGRQVQTFLRFP